MTPVCICQVDLYLVMVPVFMAGMLIGSLISYFAGKNKKEIK